MHCSLVKSCSPRRASPGILLAPSALQATAAPTAITRTMNIAGLLFNHFEAGHENVDPEPLVPVQLLAVPIPAPLGVPLYVLLEGKGKASQRLVEWNTEWRWYGYGEQLVFRCTCFWRGRERRPSGW